MRWTLTEGAWKASAAVALSLAVAPAASRGAEPPPLFAPVVAPATAADLTPSPVALRILRRAPEDAWILELQNITTETVGLSGDPRLLWLDVRVPGSKTAALCELPKELKPKKLVAQTKLTLAPGAFYRRKFDPRFFCFSTGPQQLLIPNAEVTPHFGWRTDTKGAREGTEPVIWREPSALATRESASTQSASTQSASTQSVSTDATAGWSSIHGEPFALDLSYGVWARSSVFEAPAKGPFSLEITAGSDAESEHTVQVTLSLTNRSVSTQSVFLRAEALRFDGDGPDGTFQCQSDLHLSPSNPRAFTELGAGQTRKLDVRLVEVCPPGSFARPGLYTIRATLEGHDSGQAFGLDAFVGEVSSSREGLVRVRTGERNFFQFLDDTEGPSPPRPPRRPPSGHTPLPAAPAPLPVPPPPAVEPAVEALPLGRHRATESQADQVLPLPGR